MIAILFVCAIIYAVIAHDDEIKRIQNEWFEGTGRDD